MHFKNRFFEVTEIQEHLLQYTIFGVEATDQEIQEFMNIMDKVLLERERVASIYKLENMKFLNAEHRIAIGNWTKKQSELIRKKTICVGYKTDGILGKIILNGIFLVQKPEFEYTISTNEAEIMAWMNNRINKERVRQM
jgi:hypothetical protein